MSEEQQQQQVNDKQYRAPLAAKFAGGTLLTALPVLAHFGPTGFLLSGIASLVAYRHGPEMYELARETLPFLPSSEGRKGKPEQAGPQGRSLLDRALGRSPEQGDGLVQRESPQDSDYWTYDLEDGEESLTISSPCPPSRNCLRADSDRHCIPSF